MQERLDLLYTALQGASRALILTHNDPDPDAIASAVALRYLLVEKLGVETDLAYKGIIARAENSALVRYLGRPLHTLKRTDRHESATTALVDTQPGAGNSPLPAHSSVAVVIDHHPLRETTATAAYADVRPELGSTAAILTEYLQAAGVEPPRPLATALFYGIKTDTLGLVRGASPSDVTAYLYLQPRIDIDALVDIEAARVSQEYFKQLHGALQAARLYDGAVISYIGLMNRPDLAAEMADLLSRLRGAQWVICLGAYKDDLILAIRTRSRRGGAGLLAQRIVADQGTAGGHGVMAGGQVPLRGEDPERMAHQLILRVLANLNVGPDTVARPLV